MKSICTICARGGSKGVVGKNARELLGKPLLAWTIALWRSAQPLSAVTGRAWLFLVLSALTTGASWLCYFRALKLGDAARVAPVDKLSVVVAMVLAAIFLGEHLGWQHWLGGALIVSGSMIIAWV